MSDSIKENVNQLKKKLSGLKRRSRFVDWKGIRALASELRTLVYDIKENITDPKIGIGLIASFYETDEAIFGNSDDSSGYLSEIYRFDAHDLFLHYASQYLNKDKIIDLLLKLYQQNNYGARDTLIDRATEYLPKEKIRSMLTKLQKLVDTETNAYQKNSWLHLIESLAKQIKDALLFEKTRITSRGTLSTAAYIDIAEVYFESGDPQTALTWLAHVSREERFQAEKRDQLLLAVYDALGKTDEKIAMAWQIFRRHRSADALQKLVVVIGDGAYK